MSETDGLISSDGNKHIFQVEVRAMTDEQMVAMEVFIQATPEERAKLLRLGLTARQIVETFTPVASMVVLPDRSSLQFDLEDYQTSLTLRNIVGGGCDVPDSQ